MENKRIIAITVACALGLCSSDPLLAPAEWPAGNLLSAGLAQTESPLHTLYICTAKLNARTGGQSYVRIYTRWILSCRGVLVLAVRPFFLPLFQTLSLHVSCFSSLSLSYSLALSFACCRAFEFFHPLLDLNSRTDFNRKNPPLWVWLFVE